MAKEKSQKMQDKIISLLKETPGVPVTRKNLSQALHIRKHEYHLFNNSLISMVKQGDLLHVGKHQYAFPQKSRKLTGELRTTRAGYGFVLIEGQDTDVFVAQPNLHTALDRDTVEVQLYAASRGKRLEGFVKKIVKRFREFIVGTYHKSEYYSYVVPDDPKIYRDIIVPKEKAMKALDGQKVLVRFERWERDQHNPEGSIVEILGYPDDPGVDVVSVAYSFNLPVSFTKQIEQQAQKVGDKITANDLRGREDLRDLLCFTIDPVDAKDFDDAVSLEVLNNGNRLLGVHIADVSHYVVKDSDVDKEAFRRATSVYLVDRVIPMLPERLSNHLCSLKPEHDRLTFSCFMEFDRDLEVVNYRIVPSVIHSKRRFNYQEVQDIVDGKINDKLRPVLQEMDKLRAALTKKRFEIGGIDFETPEVRFVLDEKGFPKEIIPKERLNAHRMVEEFMLAANKTVARHIKHISPGKTAPPPFLYRVHEKPDENKMQKFLDLLNALEIPCKPVTRVSSKYFQKVLNSIKGSKEEMVIEEVALRSMMKAVYSTKNIGHFGLGFQDYTHFTSPIRRYPDLTVHRLLKQYAADSPKKDGGLNAYLQKVADQSTKMERLAMEAERESIKLKQSEYISKHLGEEYNGLVSGVMGFGVFVELENIFTEGIIPIEELNDDFYIYDEKTYSLVGRDTNQVIRLGDEVRVRVESVDLERKRIEFRLLENMSDDGTRVNEKKEQPRKRQRRKRSRRK